MLVLVHRSKRLTGSRLVLWRTACLWQLAWRSDVDQNLVGNFINWWIGNILNHIYS